MKRSLPWIIIAFGTLLRLRQYVANRALWLDEAFIARNIVERGFLGLLSPLRYEDNAPVGFLMLTKIVAIIGGNSEYALRFFPLVFSIAALFFFWRVARYFLRNTGALMSLTFFSLATPLVYYAAEVKQYALDVFATLLLLYLFVVNPPKRRVWFIVLGMVILWFSHASIFVLTVLGIVYFRRVAFAIPLWIVSFAVNYIVALQYNLSQKIITTWKDFFLVFPWSSHGDTREFLLILERMFGYFIDSNSVWIQLVLLVLGLIAIERKSAKNFGTLFLPLILALVASGLEKYPFVARLMLFLAPTIYIGIGAGFETVLNHAKKVFGRAGIIATSLLIVPFILYGTVNAAWHNVQQPAKVEELKQVMEYLAKHRGPTDVIYVYYGAEAAFGYYAPRYGIAPDQYIVGVESRTSLSGYDKDLLKLKGKERVWIVFSHVWRQHLLSEDRYIAGYLDQLGKRLDYFPQVGSSLYLYDLR